jgi:hypothetical protein
MHIYRLQVVERNTLCTDPYCWWSKGYLLNDDEKSEIPECRDKGCPASAFLPSVVCARPALAFRHQDQSGTTGYGLVPHCPALVAT